MNALIEKSTHLYQEKLASIKASRAHSLEIHLYKYFGLSSESPEITEIGEGAYLLTGTPYILEFSYTHKLFTLFADADQRKYKKHLRDDICSLEDLGKVIYNHRNNII